MQATNTEVVTSEQNPLLKEIRKANARGTLTADGFALAESFHLLDEALRSGCEMQAVIVEESVRAAVESRLRRARQTRLIEVAPGLFQKLANTETSQGVIALVKPPVWTLDQLLEGNALLALLDGIQDPGNAGAIMRAAEAFGATGVIFLRGSVNPYNPKALRASAGSTFRMPLLHGADPRPTLATLAQHGIPLYAASPQAGASLPDLALTGKAAFAIGSEGRGLSDELASKARGLRIPTIKVESLNAAMAATILLYEASRQRAARKKALAP